MITSPYLRRLSKLLEIEDVLAVLDVILYKNQTARTSYLMTICLFSPEA